jgi:hypothetical protein
MDYRRHQATSSGWVAVRMNEPRTVPNLEATTHSGNVNLTRVLDRRSVVVLFQLYRAAQFVVVVQEIDLVSQHRKCCPGSVALLYTEVAQRALIWVNARVVQGRVGLTKPSMFEG